MIANQVNDRLLEGTGRCISDPMTSVRSKTLLFSFSVLLAVGGCGQPTGGIANIPDSTLVLVLADLYIADAASTIRSEHRVVDSDSLTFDEMQLGTRDQILNSHGISADRFAAALQPFIDDPPRYVALYNRVLDRLNLERRSADGSVGVPSGSE